MFVAVGDEEMEKKKKIIKKRKICERRQNRRK